MIRQQRRKELRDLDKEFKSIIKDRFFKQLVTDKVFVGLSNDDLTALKEHKHTDEKLQARFDLASGLLNRLKQIELRMKYLNERGDLKEKQNILKVDQPK